MEARNNRGLTLAEHSLIKWMLENGESRASLFLSQIDDAVATLWQCPCGCASINLTVTGRQDPEGGMDILGDYVFGTEADLAGIFIYAQGGTLSGVEVYGLAGEAPKFLPSTDALRPFDGGSCK